MEFLESTKDESRVINAILFEPKSREPLFDRLQESHFADGTGKGIFEELLKCWQSNISITATATVQAVIPDSSMGIKGFLAMGSRSAYSATWLESAEVLDRLEYSRTVSEGANAAMLAIASGSKTRIELLAEVKQLLDPVVEAPVSASTPSVAEVIAAEQEEYLDAREGRRKPMPWGIPDLDQRVKVYSGQLIIIAARPRRGKSAVMITTALHQLKLGKRVGIISGEMESSDLMRRFYCQLSGFTFDQIQEGMIGQPQESLDRLQRAKNTMAGFGDQLQLLGGEKVGIDRIKAIGYDWVKRRFVESLWLDYLTDFKLPKADSNHEAVEAASKAIRDLTRKKQLNIPIYLLAQLNRGGDNAYPQLSHLKGSSAIEQDAHVVLMIDRPEIDNLSGDGCRVYRCREGGNRDMTGKAALIIAKNRNGGGGVVFTDFHGPTMEFKQEARYEGF